MLNKPQNKLIYIKHIINMLILVILALVLNKAFAEDEKSTENSVQHSSRIAHNASLVWAVNIAGSDYKGHDGVFYQQDTLELTGESGVLEKVKGSQDPKIYQTYRQGDFEIKKALPNGVYHITLKFAEPENMPVGGRVFDVIAEDKVVIEALDVRLARDGQLYSALVRTAVNVKVEDGELNIRFEAKKGVPILNAIVVRKHFDDVRDWQLVWQDEFDKDFIDEKKWNFDQWPARKVNNEDQAYTSRLKNARVENGLLILEAHKEKYGNAEYTSARLNAQGKGDFLYGKAEVRAKLPAGQGTWSAIWMLPSEPFKYASTCKENEDWQGSHTCDAWPNSGEIDIMEHVGYDMQTVHGTVHNKAYYWMNWEQRKASVEGQDVDHAFHVYSVEWTPENITVFFDGVPYFFYYNEGKDWRSWPFDHPYHIILNLAIGGAWGSAGGPIDNTIFPVQMLVDYVRIYKRK